MIMIEPRRQEVKVHGYDGFKGSVKAKIINVFIIFGQSKAWTSLTEQQPISPSH